MTIAVFKYVLYLQSYFNDLAIINYILDIYNSASIRIKLIMGITYLKLLNI